MLALGACRRQAPLPAPAHPPLRLARLNWPGNYWVDVAQACGLFAAEGLAAQLVDTTADYFGSLDDVVAGRLDANNFYVFDLVKRNLEGADLVALIAADHGHGADGVVGRTGTLAGLRGRRVAVARGTFLEYLLHLALSREKLTLGDVVQVDVPPEKVQRAFERGDVDAAVTFEPMLSQLEKAGGRRLYDSSESPAGAFTGVWAVPRRLVERRPEDLHALVRTWERATRFIAENPGETSRLIAALYGQTPEEIERFMSLDRILGLRENRIAFTFATGYDSLHGSARRVNEFLVRTGQARATLDTTSMIDARFIRALP